jgi:hypothetical protein
LNLFATQKESGPQNRHKGIKNPGVQDDTTAWRHNRDYCGFLWCGFRGLVCIFRGLVLCISRLLPAGGLFAGSLCTLGYENIDLEKKLQDNLMLILELLRLQDWIDSVILIRTPLRVGLVLQVNGLRTVLYLLSSLCMKHYTMHVDVNIKKKKKKRKKP